MDRIASPLKNLLAKLRLEEPMQGWEAVECWPEVVGERVGARCRAVSFREGTLIVEVDSSSWMSELTYLKPRMIKDMNRRLGRDVVRDMRLVPSSTPRLENERVDDSRTG